MVGVYICSQLGTLTGGKIITGRRIPGGEVVVGGGGGRALDTVVRRAPRSVILQLLRTRTADTAGAKGNKRARFHPAAKRQPVRAINPKTTATR